MRICIVGSGAVGGMIGVKLAVSGNVVTFIDRGKHLQAIREKGLRLLMRDGGEFTSGDSRATDHYGEAGPQDVVILAVKAHQISEVAEQVPALFGPKTVLVTSTGPSGVEASAATWQTGPVGRIQRGA